MSEMTMAEKLGRFFELAAEASPNSPATLAAQTFFKKEIMRLPEEEARNPYLQNNGLQGAYLEALDRAANYRSGDTQVQTPQTYEGIMSRLPASDRDPSRGAGQVLNKLALQCGARQPDTVLSFGK